MLLIVLSSTGKRGSRNILTGELPVTEHLLRVRR